MKFNGIEFDDYSIDAEDKHVWGCICEECAKKHKISNLLLDRNYGNSTCSVKGCHNEADFYIDFPDLDLEPSSGKILGYIPNIVEFSKEEIKYFNKDEKEYLRVRSNLK